MQIYYSLVIVECVIICYCVCINYTDEYRFANMGSKVGCFAGFCHHHVTITSAYMHAYRYPLFESGTKIDP